MILRKVETTARRTFAPQVGTPDPIPKTLASADKPRGACAAIYSRKLKKKLFPYCDPKTGRINAVVTEDGDILTEMDIDAFRLIDQYFGIERIEKVSPDRNNIF